MLLTFLDNLGSVLFVYKKYIKKGPGGAVLAYPPSPVVFKLYFILKNQGIKKATPHPKWVQK